MDQKQHLIFLLLILKNFYSAKGSSKEVKKYSSWIEKISNGKNPAGKTIPYLKKVIDEIQNHSFSGNPAQDWRFIQQRLMSSPVIALQSFIDHSKYLIAYNRGKIIMRELTNSWIQNGVYLDAQGILQDAALIEAQMSSDNLSEEGINVMTTYKSKGKEFDGVIIFQNEYNSPLELRGDNKNLDRSRRLFLVGVTRARHHVFILRQAGLASPLLDNFNLNGLGDL